MRYLALALVLALTGCASSSESTSAPIESFAPCSSIKTTGAAADGTMVECLDGEGSLNINAIEGPAVITVWASWCTNCEAQRPNFIKLYEASAGRFQVIGLDVEEQAKSDGYQHALARGMSYPHLFDPDGRTSNLFGPGVPITRFIDEKNEIAHQVIGPILDYKELTSLVSEHLGIEI